jgi:predicted nucleotidyltransferase
MTNLYPTPAHERAAEAIYNLFVEKPQVEAILLVNSVARGQGTSDSDLDMAVLVSPAMSQDERIQLEQQWQSYRAADARLSQLQQAGRFTGIHLDLVDGQFVARPWDDGGGPDSFELEIGNLLAYSHPLWEGGTALAQLKRRWLPYYGDDLRRERLAMVRNACLYDLDHVSFYVGRTLYFQAFDRLYKAFQEFLQALFISRRTYPLAYNKWIHQQVVDWLKLPELYPQLPPLLSITQFESNELIEKARDLQNLVERYTVEEP